MAETTNKKHKGTHKLAFPIGCIIILLAAIGLVTVVISAVNGIDTAIDKSKHYEEYEKILTPVVLIDPDTFDDITKADMSQLLEISIWSLLKSDINPDTFESTENGLSIPKSAVEEQFVELFGTEVKSIRMGKVNLKESYCEIDKGEMFKTVFYQMHSDKSRIPSSISFSESPAYPNINVGCQFSGSLPI